jgi:predicted metal-binding membrane protein
MKPGLAAVREMACGRFWPLIALTLVGWMAVISFDHVLMLPGICAPGMSKLRFLGSVGLAATLQFNPIDGLLLSWVPMQIAMMSPLLRVPLAHVWNRSLYGRRRRAVFLFITAYASTWIGMLALLTLFSVILRTMAGSSEIVPFSIALGTALVWQGSAAKQRFINRCHALHPLPAFGLAAELGSVRFGVTTALWCIGTCWALMLLPFVASQAHLFTMAAVSLIMICERYARPRQAQASVSLIMAGSSAVLASVAATLW